jgi:hypothetical protein
VNKEFLLFKDLDFVQTYTPDASTTGQPKYYAQFDVDNFIIAPTPDANYTVDIHYLYRPASLTAGADSGHELAVGERGAGSALWLAVRSLYLYEGRAAVAAALHAAAYRIPVPPEELGRGARTDGRVPPGQDASGSFVMAINTAQNAV